MGHAQGKGVSLRGRGVSHPINIGWANYGKGLYRRLLAERPRAWGLNSGSVRGTRPTRGQKNESQHSVYILYILRYDMSVAASIILVILANERFLRAGFEGMRYGGHVGIMYEV